MELHLVMASNDGYIPYMGTSIFSLLENNAAVFNGIHIYIIDNGISEGSRQKLLAQCAAYPNTEMTFHDVRDRLSAFRPRVENGWDNTIYGRILLDDVVGEEVERAVYLDGDTIVNGSLLELAAMDMGDHCVAGVGDLVEKARRPYLGMGETARYFNSGVLVVDVKRYRELRIQRRIIEFVNRFDKRLDYPDQDAISAVCGEMLLILPPKYNFGWYLPERRLRWDYDKADYPYNYEELEETVKDNFRNVIIFHFFGPGKPWRYGECAAEFTQMWMDYNERSMWKQQLRFTEKKQMLKYYLVKRPKRWLLRQFRRILGMERYNKICGFYEEHWGIHLAREKGRRQGLL